jgi:hypothetical protein
MESFCFDMFVFKVISLSFILLNLSIYSLYPYMVFQLVKLNRLGLLFDSVNYFCSVSLNLYSNKH